jgi:hypothetical protein
VNVFHIAVCLASGCSIVHMSDRSLLLVTHFAKPEPVARAIFLDIEPMLPYPSRPRPSSMLAYRKTREAVPVDTFVADVIDRERCILGCLSFWLG